MSYYHITICLKYSRKHYKNFSVKVLNIDEKKYLKEITSTYFIAREHELVAFGINKDHIHLLINSVPKLSPLSIIKKLKQMSTHRIWINNKVQLRKHFWKEYTFWSDGYFISSIGNASEETIRKYIESQG